MEIRVKDVHSYSATNAKFQKFVSWKSIILVVEYFKKKVSPKFSVARFRR